MPLPPAPVRLPRVAAKAYKRFRKTMPWLSEIDIDLAIASARLAGAKDPEYRAIRDEILSLLTPTEGTA